MKTFTIEQLLNNKNLQGIRIVGGEQGKTNTIVNVNIIDNPDTYDWLSAGDFLLTTGYIFQNSLEMKLRLVRELADINCAGLGIKIKRYMDTIPQEMIDEANKRGLPIIEIPFHYTLAQMSNVINNEIFKREDTLLQKTVNIHNIFTQCVLHGGGVDEIARQVCNLIGNPLIIVDSKWRLLSFAEHEDNKYPITDILHLVKREKCFPLEFMNGIPRDIAEFTKSIKRRYPNEDGEIVCRILPIAADNIIYGYLVVWESVVKISAIEYMALETAATTVAIERIKAKQIEEIKHHLRQDFFDDLLAGKIESVNAVNSLAEIHNMDARRKYICMVTKIDDKIDSKERVNTLKDKVINSIDQVSEKYERNVTSIFRGNLILSFIKLKEEEVTRKTNASIREFIEDIGVSICKNCGSKNAVVGVGKPCLEFLDMQKAYMQALEAIRISKHMGKSKMVSFFDDMMIYHLLDSGIDKAYLEEFYEVSVGILDKYDKGNNTNLIETLEQYFFCNGNISNAAKKMFLHRNTFIYRIDKIKAILDTELKDSEELFEIQMGFKIMKVLKNFCK